MFDTWAKAMVRLTSRCRVDDALVAMSERGASVTGLDAFVYTLLLSPFVIDIVGSGLKDVST